MWDVTFVLCHGLCISRLTSLTQCVFYHTVDRVENERCWGVGQSAKCFLHKYENQSWIPNTHVIAHNSL